jgi:hypothetical protein
MKRSRFTEEQIIGILKDWSGIRNRSGGAISRDKRRGFRSRTFAASTA